MISTSTCSEHLSPEYWDEIEAAAFEAERVALECASDEKSSAVPFRAVKVSSAKKSKKAVGRPPKEITTRLRAIEQWFRLARSEIGPAALVGKPVLKIKPHRKTLLPSWERLEEEVKVLVSVLALFNRGSAVTFTFNLGHRLLEQLTTGDRRLQLCGGDTSTSSSCSMADAAHQSRRHERVVAQFHRVNRHRLRNYEIQ